MNDTPRHGDSSSNVPAVAIGFLLGAVAGAGIALLLAPASGSDTRRRLAETGERIGEAAREKLDQAGEVA